LKEQVEETAQVSNRNEAKHKLSYFGNSSNPGGQLYSSLCLDASSIFLDHNVQRSNSVLGNKSFIVTAAQYGRPYSVGSPSPSVELCDG
jgi:hypothetical protein